MVSTLVINIFIFYFVIWFSFAGIKISWTLFFLLQTNILNNSIYFLNCWLWFWITSIEWFWRLPISIYWVSIKCLFFFFVKWSNDFFGTSRRSLEFKHWWWAYLRRLNTAFIWKSYMMLNVSYILIFLSIFLLIIQFLIWVYIYFVVLFYIIFFF